MGKGGGSAGCLFIVCLRATPVLLLCRFLFEKDHELLDRMDACDR